jgi:hypothetical protein
VSFVLVSIDILRDFPIEIDGNFFRFEGLGSLTYAHSELINSEILIS